MLNEIILNGNETKAACAKCYADAVIRHGRTADTGASAHDVSCPNCGDYAVYVGYYCPDCVPSIDNLLTKLSRLVYDWRGYCSEGNKEQADIVAKECHKVFHNLVELGRTGKDLLPDEELPDTETKP